MLRKHGLNCDFRDIEKYYTAEAVAIFGQARAMQELELRVKNE